MAGKIGLFILSDGATDVQSLRAELQAALALLGVNDGGGEPVQGSFPTGHIETQIDGERRIIVPEGAAPFHVSGWIQTFFPREVWGDAARISYHESSWDTTARNGSVDQVGGQCNVYLYTMDDGTKVYSEESIGLFQINRCAHGGSAEEWMDMERNVRKAAELYAARGNRWGDWAVTAGRLGLL